jgi:hypothetical protein
MAKPAKLLLTSIAVTAYVALIEYAIAALPLGLWLWLHRGVSGATILSIGIPLAMLWAVAIVMLGHVWKPSSIGEARRLGERT